MPKPDSIRTRNKFTGETINDNSPAERKQEKAWNVQLNVKKPKYGTTQVRVRDDLILELKKYCLEHNLESYSGLINNIIEKFVAQIND